MSLDRRLRALCASALTGLMLAALPATAKAQTTSASVTGAVQDAQGGALPGVAVTLTSRTQGNTATATTDAEGRFVFAIVRPDTYTLTAELQGFKKLERTNLVVNAERPALGGHPGPRSRRDDRGSHRLDPRQRAADDERRALVHARELGAEEHRQQRPRRSSTSPRSCPAPCRTATAAVRSARSAASPSTASAPTRTTMSIDGVANIDTGDNGGNMATTNIDAVAEFKVLTNSYQAEYGRAVGAQLQVVTKSGSRDFHGSGYWYGRRSDWNANSWINKRNARDAEGRDQAQRRRLHHRRSDLRARLQLGQEEAVLLLQPGAPAPRGEQRHPRRRASRPLLERHGDFSQSLDTNGSPFQHHPRLPDRACPAAPTDTRGCFQDGGVLGRIPANRLYAPGLAALNIFPDANAHRLAAA